MWAGLGISFAIYFVGIFVLDLGSETYAGIPCKARGEARPHTPTAAAFFGASARTRSSHSDGWRAGGYRASGATPAASMFTTAELYFGLGAVIAIALVPVVAWH